MRRSVQMLLVVSAVHCASLAAADQTSDDNRRHEAVPLGQDDLRDITGQVMAKQPLLSSSPGIKVATANRISDEEFAVAVYHPHSEEAGIKQAFQVECARKLPNKAWNCKDASIRRYLALDSQDYEVRVTGPIGSGAAIALIEASRQVLPLVADDGLPVPDTVRNISSFDDSANVIWVDFEGGSWVQMNGHLAEGGDPLLPADWIVNRLTNEVLGIE